MKKLVNDYDLYHQFLNYINEKIIIRSKDLELRIEPHEIYRIQGEIIALRKLLKLREEVNSGN